MPSRRDFLHRSGLAASGLLLAPRLVWPARPGDLALELLFSAEALPALRAHYAADPLFRPLRAELAAFDRAAERRFLREEVRLDDHLVHLRRVSEAARRMAFLYLMTGDADAAALAVEAVRTLMRYPAWDYFLEAGTETLGLQRAPGAVIATACGADWLGDAVDDAERDAWLRTMARRGCEPCFRSLYGMRHPDRVVGWTMDPASNYLEHRPGDYLDVSRWPVILDQTNLKAVPAAALALGAAAYARRFGADGDARRWLEQARHSLGTFRHRFAPDGSYDEGVSYADYTARHLALAADALRRYDGTDLFDLINWPGLIDYAAATTLPTAADRHAIVNFGDAGSGFSAAVPLWVARRARDGRAQWFARTHADGVDEWALLWYDPSVPPAPPPPGPSLWRSDLGWIVGRTGYAAGDLVVALRSGGPANHEHADRGALIVKAFGEVLVADPYRPPYSAADPAWMLRTTAGHSALLIDGQGHQYHDGAEGTNPSDAEARLVRYGERDGYFFWTSDATPAYRLALPDVASVTRTVLVFHALPAVVVLDKVMKRAVPSRLQARFFADNRDGRGRVAVSAEGFRITRLGAVLHGVSTGAATAGRLPIPEATARRHPFAEVETPAPHLNPLLVTVLLPERGTGGAASATIRPHDDGAAVAIRTAGGSRALRVFDTGAIPEVAVSG